MARWGRMLRTASLHLSSRLVSANFPPGFFSHVFIDECGHAVEPESVVAIAGERARCRLTGQLLCMAWGPSLTR